MSSDQTFIPGEELKEDLKKLDALYDLLPPETKVRGVYVFAHSPPDDKVYLVTRLWDKYMSPKWRERSNPDPKPNSPIGKEFYDNIRELEQKAKTEGSRQPPKPGESDQMVPQTIEGELCR